MDFINLRALARTLIGFAFPVFLAACGSGSQPAGGPSASAEISQAVALPNGLALMPGAKIISTDIPGGGAQGAPTSQVSFEVGAASTDVATFYKAEFARVGIVVENDMSMQGNIILSGKAPNGEDLVINAEDGVGGAATKVTVSTAKTAG